MRLNEILEENTIKGISQKTKISEDNLESLLSSNFDNLKKIKTLGFISIIEREYKADLSALREEALVFYSQHGEENGFGVALPVDVEKKGKSKLFLIVVLALLGYASWYFFTQFDKKHLSGLIPFIDDQMVESSSAKNEDQKHDIPVADLSIANIVVKNTRTNETEEEIIVDTPIQKMNHNNETVIEEQNVSF